MKWFAEFCFSEKRKIKNKAQANSNDNNKRVTLALTQKVTIRSQSMNNFKHNIDFMSLPFWKLS